MKTTELIAIARKCGDRATNCKRECPMYGNGEGCATRLLNALATKLEMAMVVVTGIGRVCSTCIYSGQDAEKLPCSSCAPLVYDKWQWKGDAQ